MKQVLRLAWADVRHWWWLISGSCLLVLLEAWLTEWGPMLQLHDDTTAVVVGTLADWLPTLRRVCFVVLVAFVVLETPLMSSTAFWLTRPIGRMHLLLAKLLTLTTALVIWPTLVDLVVMTYRHLSPLVIILASADDFTLRLVALLSVVLAAALFSSPVRLLLFVLLAFSVGAFLLFGLVPLLFEHFAPFDFPEGPPDPPIRNNTGAMIGLLFLIVLPTALLTYQFLTRRRLRTIVAGVVGFVALVTWSTMMSPPQWLGDEEPNPPVWALKDSDTSLRVGAPAGVLKEAMIWPPDVGPARHQVAGNVFLEGVPLDYFAEVFAGASRFTLSDGTVLRGTGGRTTAVLHTDDPRRIDKYSAWQGLIGRARESGPAGVQGPRRGEQWPILAIFEASQSQTLAAQPSRYEGEFEIHLWRYRAAAELPLAPGVFSDGRRTIEIRHVSPTDKASVNLVIRRTGAWSVWIPEVAPQYLVVVRHRTRREVLTESPMPFQVASVNLLGRPASRGGWSDDGGFGFMESTQRFRFHLPVLDDRIDATWFDDAEIVIVETRYAGRIFRPLVVDPLHVTPEAELSKQLTAR